MPKYSVVGGTTSKIAQLFIQDSSSTIGAGLAGLTNNSSGLKCHYIRDKDSASVAVALTSAAIGTYTSSGFIEVESSAMPGVYQFGVPNAAVSANATSVLIHMFGATNMAPNVSEIEITATNNQDSVRSGMTALPNAAAAAANGLVTNGTGAFQISTSAGMVLVQRGSAAGQLDATSGVVTANLTSTYDFAKGTTAVTEAYAALHAAPTPIQILCEIRSILAENTVGTVAASAATVTAKKIDGSTTATTYTLVIDGSSNPTSITRAS